MKKFKNPEEFAAALVKLVAKFSSNGNKIEISSASRIYAENNWEPCVEIIVFDDGWQGEQLRVDGGNLEEAVFNAIKKT